VGIGFTEERPPRKKKEAHAYRYRTCIQCTLCNKKFYSDQVNERSRGRTCKCGNVWVGVTYPSDMKGSKYKFYVAIKYKTARPEINDKKARVRKT
jgi:uncharacterized protein (DUF169 family)